MRFSLLILLSLCPFCALADDSANRDPIDQAMNRAMEEDPSTAGMVQAISNATTQWDKKMNAVYKSLKEKMEPDEWAALVLAQRAWINYRDTQIKALQSTFSKMEGTMWVPASASKVMGLTRERARFLDDLLGIVSDR